MNDVNKIFDALMYGSYKANRGYGVTHEQLVKIGIGNDEFLARYNAEMNLN